MSTSEREAACAWSLLGMVALLGATGCRPTLPPFEADPLRTDEPSRSGFLVTPIVRAEAIDILEAERLPVLVATELYFGAPSAGATVGYAHFDGDPGVVVGASVLRFGDGIRLFDANGWRGSFTLPDINGRLYFVLGPGDPVLWASATTDLVGFRAARCLGEHACFHAALRGPTIGPAVLLVEPERNSVSSDPLGALVLGGSVEVGFAF